MMSLQPGVLEGPGMKAPLDKVAVLPEGLGDQVKFLPFCESLLPPDAMRSSIAPGQLVASGHSWFCNHQLCDLLPCCTPEKKMDC